MHTGLSVKFTRPIPELAAHLPEGHPVVLERRFDKALCAAGQGLHHAALIQMRALLPDVTRSLSERHPLALELRREIGVLHVATGDPPRAGSSWRSCCRTSAPSTTTPTPKPGTSATSSPIWDASPADRGHEGSALA